MFEDGPGEAVPRLESAMALVTAAGHVQDRVLMDAAHDAADALRRAALHGPVVSGGVPGRFQHESGSWLPVSRAEEALCLAVDALDARAAAAVERGAPAAEVLIGSEACAILMGVLQDRERTRGWAARRNAALMGGDFSA